MLIVYQLKLNTVSSILRCNNGSSIVCSGTGSDGSDMVVMVVLIVMVVMVLIVVVIISNDRQSYHNVKEVK